MKFNKQFASFTSLTPFALFTLLAKHIDPRSSLKARIALYTVLLLSLLAALWTFTTALELMPIIDERFGAETKWDIPTRVYSSSTIIHPGVRISEIDLLERIRRLGYYKKAAGAIEEGNFRLLPDPLKTEFSSGVLEIYLHAFNFPGSSRKSLKIQIHSKNGLITSIHNPEKKQNLDMLALEPELISEFSSEKRHDRTVVSLKDIPLELLQAVMAVEDHRFLEHKGVDPTGVMRSIWTNLVRMRYSQGFSTITQQLVKNFFLTPEKTIRRKLREVIMAVIIESKYSKEEILENYLNEIYFGNHAGREIHGAYEAAKFYFSKHISSLTLPECAMLAGIIQLPNAYNPFRHPESALRRRDIVLGKMHKLGLISQTDYQTAVSSPFETAERPTILHKAPYFTDWLWAGLREKFGSEILKKNGLRVFTTLDTILQSKARQAVASGLEDLEKRFPNLLPDKKELGPKTEIITTTGSTPKAADTTNEKRIQGLLIALEPQTGNIKAFVGGRDYKRSQYNRITAAYRQAGSIFKPIVFLAALSENSSEKKRFTAASILDNTPLEYKFDKQVWTPRNYKNFPADKASLRFTLENSLNIPTARLGIEIGIERIIETARKLGITSELPPFPSLSLGSATLSPLEIATAYTVFANGGTLVLPRGIDSVTDANNNILLRQEVELHQVADPLAVYVINDILKGAIRRGTGRSLGNMGFTKIAAGKTGTTNNGNDSWFAGYTTNTLAVSWVGFDSGRNAKLTGAVAALPIWRRYMEYALRNQPDRDFPRPTGITEVEIDPETGLLNTIDCPTKAMEIFIKGSEPLESCELH